MVRLIIYSVAVLWGFASSQSSALDMNLAVNAAERLVYVNLWGDIEEGDDIKFRALVLPWVRTGYLIFQVNIFSTGGRVLPAIGIGRQIRTLQTRTVAPFRKAIIVNNQKVDTGVGTCSFSKLEGGVITSQEVTGYRWCTCESACFLIWASGAVREGGVVGVHRPYFKGSGFGNLSPEEARRQYEQIEEQYRSYVNELKVPQAIVDRSIATGSESMYFLTWPEHQLMQSTPFIEEMTHSRCGSDRTEHMSAANNWTATFDNEHALCYRGILKQLMRSGAEAYLKENGIEQDTSLGPTTVSHDPSSSILAAPASVVQHWSHNGSAFNLVTEGNRKKLVFTVVRPGLQEEGVQPGAVIFDGIQNGQSLQGTAYVFSRRCGAIPYAVSGHADEEEIVTNGMAPHVDHGCAAVSHHDATMIFERAN